MVRPVHITTCTVIYNTETKKKLVVPDNLYAFIGDNTYHNGSYKYCVCCAVKKQSNESPLLCDNCDPDEILEIIKFYLKRDYYTDNEYWNSTLYDKIKAGKKEVYQVDLNFEHSNGKVSGYFGSNPYKKSICKTHTVFRFCLQCKYDTKNTQNSPWNDTEIPLTSYLCGNCNETLQQTRKDQLQQAIKFNWPTSAQQSLSREDKALV